MRAVTWVLRLLLFFFMFVFALKNTATVTLQFFFGQAWQLPLVLLLLGFFAVGILLGILAVVGALFKERRVSAGLRRELSRVAQLKTPDLPTEP